MAWSEARARGYMPANRDQFAVEAPSILMYIIQWVVLGKITMLRWVETGDEVSYANDAALSRSERDRAE